MVFALLSALAVTVVSGVAVAGMIEFEGPFVALLRVAPDDWAYLLRGVHTVAVNVLIVLAGLHIVGVIGSSVQHRENLVRAMVTGLKRRDD
jgi:cytochrome b